LEEQTEAPHNVWVGVHGACLVFSDILQKPDGAFGTEGDVELWDVLDFVLACALD
jgi:hypothetical protein